jgi:3-hydroxyacyl-[acyl-carrier-protein] dehydratase
MRFSLIDRIVELAPGTRITAVKNVSLAEEYLADHFPRAPVIPGVLMLEGLVQASAWLIRASEDFSHSTVTLREAKAVKYASFVEPGQVLRITAEVLGQTPQETRIKAQGVVQGEAAVSARLVMDRCNQADSDPALAPQDAFIIQKMRDLFAILYRPERPA